MHHLKRAALTVLQYADNKQAVLYLPPSFDNIALIELYLSKYPYRLVKIKSIDRQGIRTITHIKDGIITTGSNAVFDHAKLKDSNTVFLLGDGEYTGIGTFISFLVEVANEDTVHL